MNFYQILFLLYMHSINLLVTYAEADRRANLYDSIPTKADETLNKIGKTVEQCLKGSTAPTIFFGSSSTDRPVISTTLLSSDQISAIKMSQINIPQRYKRLQIYHFDEVMFTRKSCYAGSFILSVSSNASLAFALRELKSSIWWNSEALFLVTTNGSVENSCRLASAFFDTLWKFDILSAIYFCLDSNDQLLVYSFNPFSDSVPSFWKVVPAKDPSLNYKVLLEHTFEESDINRDYSSVCNDLYFDKTTNLNGFHMRAAVLPWQAKNNYEVSEEFGFDRYKGHFREIYAIVVKQMNLTATFKLAGDLISIEANNNPVGNLKEITSGSLDTEIMARFATLHWRGNSIAFSSSGIRFLSLKKPKSFASRFMSIFTTQVLIFYIFIFIGVLVTLKCLLKQSMSSLMLEYIRLLINHATIKQPQRFSLRLVFFYLVITFTDISIYLQSQLSAISTVEESVVIDSVDDLMRTNQPIYGQRVFKVMIVEKEIRNRYQFKTHEECLDLLFNGRDVVCAFGSLMIRYYAHEDDQLHISKSAYFSTSVLYTFREDWPLLRKFNGILLRIVEGGFDSLIIDRLENKYRKYIRNAEERAAGDIYQLEIGLYIMSFGVLLSIFTFCLELAYCKIKFYCSKVTLYQIKKIKLKK